VALFESTIIGMTQVLEKQVACRGSAVGASRSALFLLRVGAEPNMPSLHLTSEELAILDEYLQRVLSDLSVEIAGTDRKTYREEIKAERRLLQHIADQLTELKDAPSYPTIQTHSPSE
jgi:hypothetical protein